MPSTLVHVAVGGLVGTALLGERFSPRAIAVVLVAAAVPDLDSLLVVVWNGAHRALLHTLVLPVVVAVVLYWDARVRSVSTLRDRFGPDGPYVAGVALAAMVAGGLLPDLFTNGINAFWPLYDRFVTVDGELLLSNQRGIVQTFVDLSPSELSSTTENTRYSSGVDPEPWQTQPKTEPAQSRPAPERIFPVVGAGWQLMLVGLSGFVVWVRTWQYGAGSGSE